jgi:hypothetical protein
MPVRRSPRAPAFWSDRIFVSGALDDDPSTVRGTRQVSRFGYTEGSSSRAHPVGGRYRLIAALHDPAVIRKILAHLPVPVDGQGVLRVAFRSASAAGLARPEAGHVRLPTAPAGVQRAEAGAGRQGRAHAVEERGWRDVDVTMLTYPPRPACLQRGGSFTRASRA